MKVVVLLLLLSVGTLQWWDVGHMLTAAIAEMRLFQLSPYSLSNFKDVITSINSLVDNRGRTLIESACWADDLKERKYNMELWNDWHFIDK
jgi:cobyric acid synthase